MSHNNRRILDLLTIENYRKLYRLTKKLPTIKKTVKKIKVLSTMVAIMILSVSCNNDQPKKGAKIEEKVKIETDTKDTKSNLPVILFYGNSLTAGYGLEPNESFPSNIEDKIDSLGYKYKVVNAGLSGETTSGGLKRLDWVMKQKVDIFILELGANDMLRGLPLDETKKNLAEILDKVRAKNNTIKIGLCEMMAPPNMGDDYVQKFSEIYRDLSKADDVVFFPFFLDGVAGNPDLLLPDGKHPNARGQKIVAENIWKVLEGML